KNNVAIEVKKVETTSIIGQCSELAFLVVGKKGRGVYLNGDVGNGIWSVGILKNIPACDMLMKRIEKEAEDVIERMNRLMV
ncbi:hypothetical protein DFH27DRAFT_465522, partial [Peziza echinospora]